MRSLYRKYRPLKLEDVIGQPQVTEPLLKALKAGKVSHAYLFVGPRGCGKTSVARILAHTVNDFEYNLEDDYVDIIEIDGASNRGIDSIRELREKVMIAPTIGKYKVYIIDEVHMLTKEAFNALLKTLEEPPAHVIFIMATTDAYKVPVTITSRAQTYTFMLANDDVMFRHLRQIADAEGIKIDDAALKIIVKRGGGSFRDSLSLLDQISTLSESLITKDMVVAAMGLPQDEKIHELVECYKNGDMGAVTSCFKSLLSSGVKAETLAEELIETIISNPQPELMTLLSKLPEVKAPYPEARLLVALFNSTERMPNTPFQKSTPSKKTSSDARTHTYKSFDWQRFASKVQELNDAVYSQLTKTKYEVTQNELHIYPLKKIVKSILGRDNNKRILVEAADGMMVIIHDADEKPVNQKTDETLDKISAIMGGKVQNDGGGNPF